LNLIYFGEEKKKIKNKHISFVKVCFKCVCKATAAEINRARFTSSDGLSLTNKRNPSKQQQGRYFGI